MSATAKATDRRPPEASRVRECSIAEALKILGMRWALLALRELTFGVHRFDAIAGNTGAPRDILTRRLRSLETAGLLRRQLYSERPPRYEYHLTPMGAEVGDVLLALMAFGDRNLTTEPPIRWLHYDHELQPAVVCAQCGQLARHGLHDPRKPGA